MASGGGANWNTVIPRAILGVVLGYHGGQMLFGLFGAPSGLVGKLAEQIQAWGWPVPTLLAYAFGGVQFFGGVALLLGILTRFWAFAAALVMAASAWKQHWSHGFDAREGGWEYQFVLGVLALSLVVTGGGALSLDEMFFKGKKKADPPPEG